MTVQAEAINAGDVRSPALIKIWDPFVRMFHWALVILVGVALVSGDEFERLHIAVGYGIIGLIAARFIWGFLGPRHARFSDFLRPPREALGYLADVVRFRPRRYLGHNPIGGLMIIALLVLLAGLSATGYMMTTDAFWGAKWVEEVHEALASTLIGMIAVHVLGVITTSLMHRENLVKAMVTGWKRVM